MIGEHSYYRIPTHADAPHSVQTYNIVVPHFSLVDFISLYLQVPIFITFYLTRRFLHPSPAIDPKTVDLLSDQYIADPATQATLDTEEEQRRDRLKGSSGWKWRIYYWLA